MIDYDDYLDDDYDDVLRRKFSGYLPEKDWQDEPATDNQLALLRRLKVPEPLPTKKGEASALISHTLAEKKKKK